MKRDIRIDPLYCAARALYAALRKPGSAQISDAAELHSSPDGKRAVFTSTLVDDCDSTPATHICQVELGSGEIRILTFGPGSDRQPKYSPDGRYVAFLSDRQTPGNFQLYLLESSTGAIHRCPTVEGWIEYLQWSPDGTQILLGVAGHGADISGGQGAVRSREVAAEGPSWIPTVETGDETYRWRRIWLYDRAEGRVRRVSPPPLNIWEAVWCGNDRLIAVASSAPSEGLWYTSRLYILDLGTESSRELYAPLDQMGCLSASPSGRDLAIVEAVCSDRWIVAGQLRLIETATGKSRLVHTHGVDTAYTEWRSDQHLLIAGHRGFEAVVGLCDPVPAVFKEIWASREVATGGHHIRVSGIGDTGECILVGESFTRAPEIAAIRRGQYVAIKSFDLGYGIQALDIAATESVTWKAPDGLEIQGWLLRPKGEGPHPLVMNIHGGPVGHWHPAWLGRARTLPFLLLLKRGFAVFLPNPRGSTARGADFVRLVLGDIGGADTHDYLSGLDHLVAQGIAEPKRLGVTGISYGGFMTAWLITQDARFAAAVPVAPHTNQVTERLLSNIPTFADLFLDDHYNNPGGRYFQRSPVMYAHKVRTPTLNVCGALDRCTPPEEAVQFHNALLENGVKSILVTYPEEGHGVHHFPAAIDYAARVVAWFEQHMSPEAKLEGGNTEEQA